MKKTVFQRIQDVLKEAQRPIAAHEFQSIHIAMPVDHLEGGRIVDGRFYVGCSESTLSRELRKMRELGLVYSATRQGKSFKEYALIVVIPVQQILDFVEAS